MPTYDDASLTYDEIAYTYDGYAIDEVISLYVGTNDVIDEVKDGTLQVGAATHGNSLPTLSVTLEAPSTPPEINDLVKLFVNQVKVYDGVAKAIEVNEFRRSHLQVGISAQGESTEGLPTEAAYTLIDRNVAPLAKVDIEQFSDLDKIDDVTPTLPDRAKGDYLIAIFSLDSNPTVTLTTTEWDELHAESNGTSVSVRVWGKVATGDSSDALNFTLSSEQEVAGVIYSIRGSDYLVDEIEIETATGNSNSQDPPSIAPTWATKEAFYIAAVASDAGEWSDVLVTPTGYTDLVEIESGTNELGVWLLAGSKKATVASEDPSGWASAFADQWISLTIAIPAAHDALEYVSLQRQTRTTEGDTPKTTYRAVVKEHGLWANQNVIVLAENHGLFAEELTINEVTLNWQNHISPPIYSLVLGDPQVKLAQIVGHSGDDPNVDRITTTQISEGAITTPLLSTDAVIAKVANVGETVVINEDGIAITGGSITVKNSDGTTVIDGSSNMFKILASGTASLTQAANTAGVQFNDLPALGAWDTIPIAFTYGSFSNTINTNRQQGREITFTALFGAGSSGGSPTSKFNAPQVESSAGSTVRSADSSASVVLGLTNYSGSSVTYYVRYHVCMESAF